MCVYADLKANLTAMPGHIGDLACITAYARARARARAHTHTHTAFVNVMGSP